MYCRDNDVALGVRLCLSSDVEVDADILGIPEVKRLV